MKAVGPNTLKNLPFRQLINIGIHKLIVLFVSFASGIHAKILLYQNAVKVGKQLRINGRLRCLNRGEIIIGDNVRINSGHIPNFVGGSRATYVWVGPNAHLEIGDDVGISNSTIIARSSIRILHGTLIGGGCDIYDNDFHELLPEERESKQRNINKRSIKIGPRAFVGGHTIILKGVNIGEGAVIGAGSLVANDIPSYEIWAGRPACFVKKLVRRETTFIQNGKV